jgi:biotin carboxyl carrier protein
MKYVTSVGKHSYQVEILDEHHVLVDGKPYEVDFTVIAEQPVFSLLIDGRSFEANAAAKDDGWQILLHGKMYEVRVEDEQAIRARAIAHPVAAEIGEYHLRAPMPGLVVGVPVTAGQTIEKGGALVILESMKMQNELRSPKAGTVQEVRVQTGQTVDQNQVMVVIV